MRPSVHTPKKHRPARSEAQVSTRQEKRTSVPRVHQAGLTLKDNAHKPNQIHKNTPKITQSYKPHRTCKLLKSTTYHLPDLQLYLDPSYESVSTTIFQESNNASSRMLAHLSNEIRTQIGRSMRCNFRCSYRTSSAACIILIHADGAVSVRIFSNMAKSMTNEC